MRFFAGLALIVASFGCGGQSRSSAEDGKGHNASGGMSGSTTGSGGSAPAGSSGLGSSTAGTSGSSGGSAGTCFEAEFTEICVATCFADETDFTESTCVGGAWSCPSGMILQPDCPPESCAGALTHCCAEYGRSTYRDCGADGLRLACATGARPIAFDEACVPVGVEAEHCIDLDGMPCAPLDLACDEGPRACQCTRASSTSTVWQCFDFD